MTRYRAAIRAGRPPLGAHVVATEAARVVAELIAESYTKTQIAAWLGHRWPQIRGGCLVGRGAGVTLRTVLRLRAMHRRLIS